MKKNLFLIPIAALAFAACTNETTEYVGSGEAREISFNAIATPATRAAVDGTDFTPTTMKVTAYDATASANYFSATTFTKASTTWKGGKYWPFTSATINFLAIANANADNESGVTWGPTISETASNPTEKVQIVMGDNSENQYDLMYACGTGTVSQTDNNLSFPASVPMAFKHAQAWIKFYVQAANESTEALTINSITLNSVSCQGTYLVTHANWNETKATRDAATPAGSKNGAVSGEWSSYDTYAGNKLVVKDAGYTALDYDASVLPQYYGSLMVVPNQGMASFTINYTVGGNTYNYTYTPASTSLSQATKYTYNITFTLNEIEIAPTVENWTGGETGVTVGGGA